jgi:tryptophan-rich sensory protein
LASFTTSSASLCFAVLASTYTATLVLLLLVLLGNALWSVFFFRWRELRISFIAFIPYATLVAVLVLLLSRSYPLGAALFMCYCAYLVYATLWGYRLWQLNSPNET